MIATHRRETRLAFALEALAAQTLDHERFEVIIVRSEAAGPRTCPPPLPAVRELCAGRANIALQRNLGWRAASAPIVAFTDDDCRPQPDWLERLLARTDGAQVFVQGRTRPDGDEGHLDYGIARTIRVEGPDRWFQTCNIAYPRRLLERLGGFDERLSHHCEDTDLGLRAERIGARPLFAADAVVLHAVHVRGLREAIADARRLSGEPALIARFPQQREQLYMRYFVHPDHAKLLLVLAGLLWHPNVGVVGVLTLPYVHGRLRRRSFRDPHSALRGLGRAVADSALEAVVDAVEIASRLRSSVRHRRLVL